MLKVNETITRAIKTAGATAAENVTITLTCELPETREELNEFLSTLPEANQETLVAAVASVLKSRAAGYLASVKAHEGAVPSSWAWSEVFNPERSRTSAKALAEKYNEKAMICLREIEALTGRLIAGELQIEQFTVQVNQMKKEKEEYETIAQSHQARADEAAEKQRLSRAKNSA